MVGGTGFDGTSVLASSAGAGIRGAQGGFTVAFHCVISTQEAGGNLIFATEAGVKGFVLRQPTATTVTFEVGNGAARLSSSPYYPETHIGTPQLLVGVFDGSFVDLWAADRMVGRRRAFSGTYSIPSAATRNAIAASNVGAQPHPGLTVFGWAGWDRALSESEIHSLYDHVRTAGVIPVGLSGESVVCNVASSATGSSFPSVVQDSVGSSDFTFISGSSASIAVVRTKDAVAWAGEPTNPTPIDVWVGLGESHMAGRGDIADAEPGYEPGPQLMMLKAGGWWETLVEPTSDDVAVTPDNGVGPLGLFGWEALKVTGRLTGIINCGVGGSTTPAWLPGQPFLSNALDKIAIGMSRRNATFGGFLTFIGNNDARSVSPTVWKANWTATMNEVRAHLGSRATDKPELVLRLSVRVPGAGAPYPEWANVRADRAAYIAENALALEVEGEEGMLDDGIHYSTAENQLYAERALAAAMAHYSWESP